MMTCPILIPAYEPDERLIDLLESLVTADARNIILVNDGSGPDYDRLFDECRPYIDKMGGKLLIHEVNKGKGAALKTGFAYILEAYPDAVGCVTADSDGQHDTDSINAVIKSLTENPDHLILGVRSFDSDDIPWKSVYGNKITAGVMKYVTGLKISDTQTGLRGIPTDFMRELLDIKGNRFEFETEMLLCTIDKYPITEVPIPAIYDSVTDHKTHFNTFKDSIKIYRILCRHFIRYTAASLSSALLDIILFAVFCRLFGRMTLYVEVSTVAARLISGTYNYIINHIFVFNSKNKKSRTAVKYFILAVIQMGLSAGITGALVRLIAIVPEIIIKMVTDTVLFILSFKIQQKYVFGKNKSGE
ncbi:MAG: bifunctional glycosyltransferase family 2/GtrA family protein [Lachnospiraceae bacterium]|nr:bifunctional glycosyltransferase family 2/GtrA family protein [Lachnospiraceae bacterium]